MQLSLHVASEWTLPFPTAASQAVLPMARWRSDLRVPPLLPPSCLQACRRMEFEGVAPLLSHMSDMGWAAVQHCVTQLCGQLHCSSAWLVEQETFKPMTLSCYTERDPISPLPVALGTCLATATDQLAAIAHEAVRSLIPLEAAARAGWGRWGSVLLFSHRPRCANSRKPPSWTDGCNLSMYSLAGLPSGFVSLSRFQPS